MEIKALFQNSDFIVCVKPVGVISEDAEGGMPSLLRAAFGCDVYAVHRLDRTTGGVMVYAKTKSFAAMISEQIQNGTMQKEYLAVVRGIPAEDCGEMRDLLYHDKRLNKSFAVKKSRSGVKDAYLEYATLETVHRSETPLSLVRVHLHTGRTHQIRVQFASRKLPLYGDGKYGGRTEKEGIALWSQRLSFEYPRGSEVSFCAMPGANLPWSLFKVESPV